ncbi:MAG: ATP-binding protein, partial [Nitriliruptorales bacterium]|nr:ATP-binding protein [Nitriliruptorales bacterium]
MRSATDNPFTPGYGVVPQVFAGRQPEFADFEGVVLKRVAEGIYEPARLLTGDRGMGKTALLKQFEAEAREAGHWVVRVSAVRGDAIVADLLEALANVLVDHDATTGLGREARASLKRLAGLVIGRTGVSVQELPRKSAANRAHRDLTEILVDVGSIARDRQTALLLLLDESQNIDRATIGALFHAFQEAQGQTVTERHETGATLRAHLPLAIYVAGLPGLPAALRAAGSTFGERAHRIELGLLSEGDVAEALTAFAEHAGVTVDADAADRFVELVGG